MKYLDDPWVLLTSGLAPAARQWRKRAERLLVAHDISEASATALLWTGRLGGGVRQVTLASYVGIEGTSLVRLLDQLSAAGLLERRNDPDDRRANTVWLTPAGEALAARIEIELAALRAQVFRLVDPADVKAVLRVFAALDQPDAAEAPALPEGAA